MSCKLGFASQTALSQAQQARFISNYGSGLVVYDGGLGSQKTDPVLGYGMGIVGPSLYVAESESPPITKTGEVPSPTPKKMEGDDGLSIKHSIEKFFDEHPVLGAWTGGIVKGAVFGAAAGFITFLLTLGGIGLSGVGGFVLAGVALGFVAVNLGMMLERPWH